jgi:DNA-damage-inducible protein D
MANDVLPAGTSGGEGNAFDAIKKTNPTGHEFWTSRDLARVLGYTDYRNFDQVVQKSRLACFNSGQKPEDHFVDVTEMVAVGKGAQREVSTTYLSRYACYLAIQNADPGKPNVAIGQTYFASQTRRQEISDSEKEKDRRLLLRGKMKRHNAKLADAARGAGVIESGDYAVFQNHGYMGLYGGLTAKHLHKQRGLGKSQHILDHMGSTELAANLFRATQTEEKLRREGVTGKDNANRTHREVGAKVRHTIEELGGTMPEDLPVEESVKKLSGKRPKKLR